MPHPFLFAVDTAAIFAVLALGCQILATNGRNKNAQLLACICFSSACARLLARHDYRYFIPDAYRIPIGFLETPLNLACNLAPGIFMVLCWRLFRDESRFPRVLVGLWLVQLVLDGYASVLTGEVVARQRSLPEALPALLELLFTSLGLYWSVRGWKEDLVESRRRLRWVFLAIVGSYVLAAVLFERLVISWSDPLLYPIHVGLSLFGAVLVACSLFAMFRSDIRVYLDPFREEKPSVDGEPSDVVPNRGRDDTDLSRLQQALSVERVYRDGSLSIAKMAAHLKIPEYRLRRLIHERMGYRNFNALLHDHRIADACTALADPDQRNVPVLTIALSLGYNSINPFNRAFREAKGMTPSEFRAKAQNDVKGASKS